MVQDLQKKCDLTEAWDAFQLQPCFTLDWITFIIHLVLPWSIKWDYSEWEQRESWKGHVLQDNLSADFRTYSDTGNGARMSNLLIKNMKRIWLGEKYLGKPTSLSRIYLLKYYVGVSLRSISGKKQHMNFLQRQLWMSEIMLIWPQGSRQFR